MQVKRYNHAPDPQGDFYRYNYLLFNACRLSDSSIETVRDALAQGANPNAIDATCNTVIGLAARNHPEYLPLLFNAGADPNLGTETPLCSPVIFSVSDLDTLKLFHQRGAKLNAVNDQGNSLLHLYALRGDVAMFEYALDNGVDINVQNLYGQTPAHVAYTTEWYHVCTTPNESNMAEFIERNTRIKLVPAPKHSIHAGRTAPMPVANLDQAKLDFFRANNTKGGYTPRKLCKELIRLLIIWGADLTITDKAGLTPKEYSIIAHCNFPITKYEQGKAYYASEVLAAIKKLKKDKQGKVIPEGHLDIVKTYLDEGGDIHIQQRGKTFLHEAASLGRDAIVEHLLSNGINPDLVADDPRFAHDWSYRSSPLFLACTRSIAPNCGKVIERLLKAGADVNRRCTHNLTPFLQVCLNQDWFTIQLMLRHAFDQLTAIDLAPSMPDKHRRTLYPKFHIDNHIYRSADDLGNAALKLLCEIYLRHTNRHAILIPEYDKRIQWYDNARQKYRKANEHYQTTLKKYQKTPAAEMTPTIEKAFDDALKNLQKCAKASKSIRFSMQKVSDASFGELQYKQTQSYHDLEKRLFSVIKVILPQVQVLDDDVRSLMEQNRKLNLCLEEKAPLTL